jgi:hypothetical protein
VETRRDGNVAPLLRAVTLRPGPEYESPSDALLFLSSSKDVQMALLTCATERLTRQCGITVVMTEYYCNSDVIIWYYVSEMLSPSLIAAVQFVEITHRFGEGA